LNIASTREIGAWVMLNALWLPLTFQDTALMTIAVPASTARLAPDNHVFVLSVLASVAALAAMVVPPLGGWLSDALRRRGGSRRNFVAAGIVIDVGALIALSYAHSLMWFAFFLVLATAGANVALCAYQALLPELVPRRHWGGRGRDAGSEADVSRRGRDHDRRRPLAARHRRRRLRQ
jgi:MFS family permease